MKNFNAYEVFVIFYRKNREIISYAIEDSLIQRCSDFIGYMEYFALGGMQFIAGGICLRTKTTY